MTHNNTQKGFVCEKCHFKCFKPSNYQSHLATAKHKLLSISDKMGENNWECLCGKSYTHRHNNKCNYNTLVQIMEVSIWRTLYTSNKNNNDIGHSRRIRSFSI